jgi:D-glycero-alpha-D-manno-heptose-7-phosphate kinase
MEQCLAIASMVVNDERSEFMIKSIAPCRLSLLGGGTDVGEYQKKYGGLVLNLAINIRQEIELDTLGYEDAVKPTFLGFGDLPKNSDEDFFMAFVNHFELKDIMFDQKFEGEITGGIGSSAALAVALVGGISKLKGLDLPRRTIAETAWSIETRELGMTGGKQDQYAAAYGGVNVFEFGELTEVNRLDEKFIEPIINNIVLFHTGKNRKLPDIQKGLEHISTEQKEALDYLKSSVMLGIEALTKKDPETFGVLMDNVWQAKKKSNKVTTHDIDRIYEKAIKLGAWGGKVCGAGGGGYMFFICPEDKKQGLINNLGIKHIDFAIDFQGLDVREI